MEPTRSHHMMLIYFQQSSVPETVVTGSSKNMGGFPCSIEKDLGKLSGDASTHGMRYKMMWVMRQTTTGCSRCPRRHLDLREAQLGLLQDDTMYEDVKRLPEDKYNERIFRINRALDLSMRQQILPKEQWVKYEEDQPYLQPYLKEVIRERFEREEWDKK
nr:cytochrome b-c1 complex subunit 7-like [Anolis sagrei ordinatus]